MTCHQKESIQHYCIVILIGGNLITNQNQAFHVNISFLLQNVGLLVMLGNKATQNYINQITKSQSQELQGKEDSPPEYKT